MLELHADDEPAFREDREALLLGVLVHVADHLRRREHLVGGVLQLRLHLAVHDDDRLGILKTDARALVPRPETEVVVERCLDLLLGGFKRLQA